MMPSLFQCGSESGLMSNLQFAVPQSTPGSQFWLVAFAEEDLALEAWVLGTARGAPTRLGNSSSLRVDS